ncbi:MAG: hypothetical protein QM771_16190 [Nitrospira sp.]
MKPLEHSDGLPLPEPYLTTEVSDRLIQGILDAFNHEQLTPHQARLVLSRVRHLIDIGELIARRESH